MIFVSSMIEMKENKNIFFGLYSKQNENNVLPFVINACFSVIRLICYKTNKTLF